MYRAKKTMTISASHRVSFGKGKFVEPLHGHNWRISVYCESETLDEDGFVVNFLDIEELVKGQLDHTDLNESLGGINPSTENLARWIAERVPNCYKVKVWESEGAEASYEK